MKPKHEEKNIANFFFGRPQSLFDSLGRDPSHVQTISEHNKSSNFLGSLHFTHKGSPKQLTKDIKIKINDFYKARQEYKIYPDTFCL